MSRSQSDKISATGLAFISARDKQLPIALIAGESPVSVCDSSILTMSRSRK